MSNSLLYCANFESAHTFCSRGIKAFPENKELGEILEQIETSARFLLKDPDATLEDFTDRGRVRREIYPWNDHEPDRHSNGNMDLLNNMLKQSAPKLEVLEVELPSLRSDGFKSTRKQLGLFAKEDLAPGEVILDEKSLLTATGRLNDVFCDACSAKLSLKTADAQSCEECYEVVFCSSDCATRAQEEYHPAVCSAGVDSIARDAPPTEAATALYTLLLLRTLAMAITQSEHPLDLPAVKHIWGDFNPVHNNADEEAPKTLPFNFKYNILLPLNFLEIALDNADPVTNIFTSSISQIWIFNTLLAKFRGTASAKQDLSGRPEVAAVHPMWCLANHSCDPNSRWEWEGSMKFWVREKRVAWSGKGVVNQPGIKKGDELISHYCDLDFDVKARREWAEGALGGNCICPRCLWEADGIESVVQ